MIDLCNIVLKKIRGESIVGHPSIERCVEYRVILEKIKAIDLRLAYQLNKLITLPEDAPEQEQRVDVKNLDVTLDPDDDNEAESDASDGADDSEDGDEDDVDSGDVTEDESDDGGPAKGKADSAPVGIYKPPKLRSVAYTEGKDVSARRRDYNDFYRDDESGDVVDESRHHVDEERVRFEEEHYTRLPDSTKKTKRKLKGKGNKKFKTNKKRR